MFPWVNRIEKVPFPNVQHIYKDGNGIPLHGLYVDSPRKVQISTISADSIGIELTPEVSFVDVPPFTETFILSKGKLHQTIKVHPSVQEKLPFCFGYHPYLQINQENIKDLSIKTDIETNLKLDEVILNVYSATDDSLPLPKDKH